MHQQNYFQFSFLSLRKFAIAFLMLTIIVPGSFMYLPQKAEAIPVVILTVVSNWIEQSSLAESIVQTIKQIYILAETVVIKAKAIITAAQTTITAIKTTYLALKEAYLDPIARLVSALMSNMLVKMMFSFISTGNSGAPAFVTNPLQYFGGVAEEATQVFLTDLRNNRPDRLLSINQAVNARITAENYVDPETMKKSDFPGGDAGYQAFLQDASKCVTKNSWDCYFASLQPQNNPWDIYQFESQKLAGQRANNVKLSQDEILAGSGYHTLKDCIERDAGQGGFKLAQGVRYIDNTGTYIGDANGKAQCIAGACMSVGGGTGGNCTEYLNKTPGDILAKSVDEYLSTPLKLLQAADELDEVMTQGVGMVQCFMNGKGLITLASCE